MVEVDIINLALSYLGDGATVASINPPEGSAQAQHAARFYPIDLQTLLEAHNWNFTTKRVALAPLDTNYAGWAYCYAYPADASDLISVLPQARYEAAYWTQIGGYGWQGYWGWLGALGGELLEFEQRSVRDYQIELNSAGQQVVLSNAESAIARYTSTQVRPGIFPAQFTKALSYLLASSLAGALIKGDAGAAMSQKMLAFHQVWLSKAMMQDANQRKGNQQPVPSGILARY